MQVGRPVEEKFSSSAAGAPGDPPTGSIRRTYTAAEVDAIAAYNLELDRCFLIPIARVEGRPAIALRLSPCSNNQRRRINWADDFDFGGYT